MTRKTKEQEIIEQPEVEVVQKVEEPASTRTRAKLVNRTDMDVFLKYSGSQIKLHSFGELNVVKEDIEEKLPNGVYLIS